MYFIKFLSHHYRFFTTFAVDGLSMGRQLNVSTFELHIIEKLIAPFFIGAFFVLWLLSAEFIITTFVGSNIIVTFLGVSVSAVPFFEIGFDGCTVGWL